MCLRTRVPTLLIFRQQRNTAATLTVECGRRLWAYQIREPSRAVTRPWTSKQ